MTIQFISRKAHGIIDWLTVGMLPALPRIFGWSRPVTRLHDLTAGAIAASSAVTNYPTGIVKLMPMQTHLMLDKMNGAVFLAAATIMSDEPDQTRCCMAATGLFLLVQGFCTKAKKEEQAPPRGSLARRDPVRRYAEQTRPDIYPAGEPVAQPASR